jgi:hypothetical protein
VGNLRQEKPPPSYLRIATSAAAAHGVLPVRLTTGRLQTRRPRAVEGCVGADDRGLFLRVKVLAPVERSARVAVSTAVHDRSAQPDANSRLASAISRSPDLIATLRRAPSHEAYPPEPGIDAIRHCPFSSTTVKVARAMSVGDGHSLAAGERGDLTHPRMAESRWRTGARPGRVALPPPGLARRDALLAEVEDSSDVRDLGAPTSVRQTAAIDTAAFWLSKSATTASV